MAGVEASGAVASRFAASCRVQLVRWRAIKPTDARIAASHEGFFHEVFIVFIAFHVALRRGKNSGCTGRENILKSLWSAAKRVLLSFTNANQWTAAVSKTSRSTSAGPMRCGWSRTTQPRSECYAPVVQLELLHP